MISTPLFRLSLGVVSLVLGTLVAEAVVRLSPIGEKFGWQVPETLSQRLDRYGRAPSSGGLTIAAFGDSMVEYFRDTNRNFVHIAAQRIEQSSGRPVRVLNFGFGGTGLRDYRVNFEYAVTRKKFDVALFAIYSGNDFLDYWVALLAERNGVNSPGIPKERELPRASGGNDLRTLLKRSVLLNLLWRNVVKYNLGVGKTDFLGTNVRQLSQLFGEDESAMWRKIADLPNDYGKMAEADVINAWLVAWSVVKPDVLLLNKLGFGAGHKAVERGVIEELRALMPTCREHKIRCVFVFIPPSESVHEKYHEFYRKLGYDLDSRVIGSGVYELSAIDFLRREGFAAMSLWTVLAQQEDNIYLPLDMHFNVKGNEVAGIELGKWLAGVIR